MPDWLGLPFGSCLLFLSFLFPVSAGVPPTHFTLGYNATTFCSPLSPSFYWTLHALAGNTCSVFRFHAGVTGHRVVSQGGRSFGCPGPAVAAFDMAEGPVIPVGHSSLKCMALLGTEISISVLLVGPWKQTVVGLFRCVWSSIVTWIGEKWRVCNVERCPLKFCTWNLLRGSSNLLPFLIL